MPQPEYGAGHWGWYCKLPEPVVLKKKTRIAPVNLPEILQWSTAAPPPHVFFSRFVVSWAHAAR
jgi:hypothetical protein